MRKKSGVYIKKKVSNMFRIYRLALQGFEHHENKDVRGIGTRLLFDESLVTDGASDCMEKCIQHQKCNAFVRHTKKYQSWPIGHCWFKEIEDGVYKMEDIDWADVFVKTGLL